MSKKLFQNSSIVLAGMLALIALSSCDNPVNTGGEADSITNGGSGNAGSDDNTSDSSGGNDTLIAVPGARSPYFLDFSFGDKIDYSKHFPGSSIDDLRFVRHSTSSLVNDAFYNGTINASAFFIF